MSRMWSMVLAGALIGGTIGIVSFHAPDARAERHRRHTHGGKLVTTTTTTAPNGSTTTTTTLPACALPFAPVDSALGALLDEVDAEQLSGRLHNGLTHLIDETQRLEDDAAAAACGHQTHKSGSLLKAAIRSMIAFEYRVRSLTGRHGGANGPKLLGLADGVLKALRSLKAAL